MLFDRRFDRIERNGTDHEKRHRGQNQKVTVQVSDRSEFLQALAYPAMSFACNKPETMTTRFAPASITCARFSDLIPPMQKMGMETRWWTSRMCARPTGE